MSLYFSWRQAHINEEQMGAIITLAIIGWLLGPNELSDADLSLPEEEDI